jgi:starch synthase (maltosyl-transferring)
LADEDLATQTGQANQSRVRSQFTVEAMVDAYRELYAKIVA